MTSPLEKKASEAKKAETTSERKTVGAYMLPLRAYQFDRQYYLPGADGVFVFKSSDDLADFMARIIAS